MTPNNKIAFCILVEGLSGENILRNIFHFSKSQIKKLKIKKGFLQKKFLPKDLVELESAVVNRNLITPVFSSEKNVEILFEDDQIIAVNKPAGLHGHPQSYQESSTVLNALRAQTSTLSLGLEELSYERGLLYRLDQVTSGLLIYIKNYQDQSELKLLRENLFEKEYLTVVCGQIDEQGELTHLLKGSSSKGSVVRVSNSNLEEEGARECKLRYQRVYYSEKRNLSLVKVHLETGFRHQIRVQMAAIGFPLYGDTLYGGEDFERVLLHAYRYRFKVREEEYDLSSELFLIFDDLLNLNGGLKVILDKLL